MQKIGAIGEIIARPLFANVTSPALQIGRDQANNLTIPPTSTLEYNPQLENFHLTSQNAPTYKQGLLNLS